MDWSSIPWEAVAAIGTWFTGIVMIITIYKTIYMNRAKRIALRYSRDNYNNKSVLTIFNDGNRPVNINSIRIYFRGDVLEIRDNEIENFELLNKKIEINDSIKIIFYDESVLYELIKEKWTKNVNNSVILQILRYNKYSLDYFRFKFLIYSDYDVFISKKWTTVSPTYNWVSKKWLEQCGEINYELKYTRRYRFYLNYTSYPIIICSYLLIFVSLMTLCPEIIDKTGISIYVIILFTFVLLIIIVANKFGQINGRESIIIFLILFICCIYLIITFNMPLELILFSFTFLLSYVLCMFYLY
ncbi:MAG: hypothetical protein KRP56_06410 [Candidatus Methanogranum gryphiswaldense]|nr:MAG: hypothetical protein KRP56_06410 [Candidatus Methanogranum sp. U3.2.1]